ncbi:MAG: transporter periplasmic ligand-binding protein [Rhodospirillales bacterium]|nr:transporter periplasmic ligand-binding protein [Rhodospirillales bacterium]
MIRSIHRLSLGVLAALAAIALSPAARADDVHLVVNVFAGLQNLPLFAAQDRGFFAKRGLVVEIQNTPNSQAQRDGLAQGKLQIAHAAVDNAVYMAETGAADVVIVAGGDDGMNELVVQPEIRSIADIRGKTVVVDAVNTAFAFQLYRILELNGLGKGDYEILPKGGSPLRMKSMLDDKANAAAVLGPPFVFLAEKQGLKRMGSAVKFIGPYQGGGIIVLRSWAKANAPVLVNYLQAVIEGARWAMEPKNQGAAATMLIDRLKIDQDLAAQSLPVAFGTGDGMAKDARFDMKGFENMLELRAEFGDTGKAPAKPEAYVDLSYYEQAMKGM